MADSVPSTSDRNSFSITIEDDSPTVVYSPFADTFGTPNITSGWNPFFSGSGFASNSPDLVGSGTGLHVTAADGASLTIGWNGSAISVFGILLPTSTPSSATYSVLLDGVPTTNYASSSSTPPNYYTNVLAAFSNLTNSDHTVVLTMHNPDHIIDGSVLLQFDRAVLTTGAPPIPSNQSNISSSVATSTLPDDSISFRGEWSFSRNLLINQSIPFHMSTNIGDSSHFPSSRRSTRHDILFCFDIQMGVFPPKGTAITISGLSTTLSGSYNISVDDETPLTFSARSSFNASAPTVLYYRTGLDPNRDHVVDVVNVGATQEGEGSMLALGVVNITTVQLDNSGSATPISGMSSSSSSLPGGAIAGIVVAAVVVVLSLVILVIYLWRRRRQSTQRKRNLLINPGLGRLRRLSFIARSIHSRQGDPEKSDPTRDDVQEVGRSTGDAVLDISPVKEESDDDDEHGQDIRVISRVGSGRHASQNSDGSYSIDLPDLSHQGTYSPLRISVMPRSSPVSRPTSASQGATRSPRPRGPRNMNSPLSPHTRDSSRGILLSHMEPVISPEGDIASESKIYGGPSQASPLRVNFEDEAFGTSLQRREGRYTSAGVFSLPQSLKQALSLAPQRAEDGGDELVLPPPGPHEGQSRRSGRESHYSFLDMESSASASLKSGAQSTRQSRSSSNRTSSHNTSSDQPVPDVPTLLLPDLRKSLHLSMAIGAPSSSRPSASPHISLKPVSLPSPATPQEPLPTLPMDIVSHETTHSDSPNHPQFNRSSSPEPDAMKSELPEMLPSPTDSIPLTVSDIHFRHSSYSTVSQSESRRASAVQPFSAQGVLRSPHPPLPNSPHSASQSQPPVPETRPFIVQKLLGMPTGSGPSTPFSSPTIPAFHSSGSGPSGRASALPTATASSTFGIGNAPSSSALPPSGSSTSGAIRPKPSISGSTFGVRSTSLRRKQR
ncbi:hypothetical protein C8Q75DRAFT_808179 [Abortiporus biennis]|nr:hypothetical protein C8Q75DRAFT_808179 [Abortiporus biennis]